MELNPGGLVAWLLTGLVAGWIAGQITRGEGFGCLGNIALGIVGAIIGGALFSLADFEGAAGILGSIVIATIGAVLLLALANLIGRR